MIQRDTIKLLRECDAGVRMGMASIADVEGRVHACTLRQKLLNCSAEHEKLGGEIRRQLYKYRDKGKAPSPVARQMSRMMTGMKLAVHPSDRTVADLMTDGCNMGVKSLNRYLNQYTAADERSKDIAKRLIHLEQQLTADIRDYL